MKLNEFTRLASSTVILVPYRQKHVEKYHEWMKSEELQFLTASEPLTLEEEYEMQKSWQEDEDKCTFIILDAQRFSKTSSELDSMIGDTNLYIKHSDGKKVAEIEIMIAEKHARGKKLGWESIIMMILYGIKHIQIKHFQAKISVKNSVSLNMFKKLKFSKASMCDFFNEITVEKDVTDEWARWLNSYANFTVEHHRD